MTAPYKAYKFLWFLPQEIQIRFPFSTSDLIDVIMQNIEESLEKLTSDLKGGGDKSALNYYNKISGTGTNFNKIKQEYNNFLDQLTSSEVVNYNDGSSATITKKDFDSQRN